MGLTRIVVESFEFLIIMLNSYLGKKMNANCLVHGFGRLDYIGWDDEQNGIVNGVVPRIINVYACVVQMNFICNALCFILSIHLPNYAQHRFMFEKQATQQGAPENQTSAKSANEGTP
ncbi:hypothetical protein ACJX0J_015124 [Zea mays]